MKPHYTLSELKTAAAGRWHEMHTTLGIPSHYLTGKHQPCPHCGGKDRFRYTNHQGNGGFICNQCTPQGGSGFDLLMLVFGYSFSEAAEQVATLLGLSAPQSHTEPRQALPLASPSTATEKPYSDKIDRLITQWQQAHPLEIGDPVHSYLKSRGLALPPDSLPITLRYAPSLSYWHQGEYLGNYPAMLAAITTPTGQLMGLHQTYLMAIEQGYSKLKLAPYPNAPAKKMQSRYTGAISGNAAQLYPIDQQGRLIIAEGIETALAAQELISPRLPVWACLSAGNLARLRLPESITEIVIIADNDSNQTGQRASDQLARRAIKQGISVKQWLPENEGQDALDVFNQWQQKTAQHMSGKIIK